MALGDVHPQATCCWCGAAFVVGQMVDAEVWLCPTEACYQRQARYAMVAVVAARGRPRADGSSGSRRCVFVPLPNQVPLWESGARKILWGGQAGPGKSTGGRRYAYDRSMRVPEHETLILRENWEQLDKTHLRKMEREVEVLGGRFYKSDRKVEFGQGSTASIIDCGHMADMEAVSRYLSTEYSLILADEASLYPVDTDGTTPLAELSTRARKMGVATDTGAVVVPQFVALTNPGGPSAAWLREMFIDHEPDFEKYPALRREYRAEEWVYLPARLDDNPYLDPEYEASLSVLNRVRYEQLRHGDWSVFSGQFFSEYMPSVHVREAVLS